MFRRCASPWINQPNPPRFLKAFWSGSRVDRSHLWGRWHSSFSWNNIPGRERERESISSIPSTAAAHSFRCSGWSKLNIFNRISFNILSDRRSADQTQTRQYRTQRDEEQQTVPLRAKYWLSPSKMWRFLFDVWRPSWSGGLLSGLWNRRLDATQLLVYRPISIPVHPRNESAVLVVVSHGSWPRTHTHPHTNTHLLA